MGRPILTNLLCPFLVPQCSTYLPTQNRDVINGCSQISLTCKLFVLDLNKPWPSLPRARALFADTADF